MKKLIDFFRQHPDLFTYSYGALCFFCAFILGAFYVWIALSQAGLVPFP